MSGSLRHAWEHLAEELWEPLAQCPAAPLDLYSDLFAAAEEYLSPRPTETELGEARNNPSQARQRFLALKGTDFTSESDIVRFLETTRDVIADYEIEGFEGSYRRLLRDVVRKFNLRYRLDEPFVLRFLLPGSFTNLYQELHRLDASNTHLAGLLTDFEKAFDRYARTEDASDLKTCIAKASNYAEGLASVAAGIPEKGNTLGALCNQTGDWPHEQVKDALKNLYKFCSDYPGIRHSGNPAGVLRSLGTRDLTLASLLLLSFSGYFVSSLDQRAVLGV
jgi:hypothetical protein